ncbi:hypothetical protein RCL_jg16281.t1 [Rhizophagus clarus]|uniref:Uncharacterized protein n=1 Tax=Rhizophagus clarus TaxID=94130 RepID=A0A8H3QZR2_9GLOM|nr:hypothetical protein RCL_jg16281.t1 [Rhizophagus clarus]
MLYTDKQSQKKKSHELPFLDKRLPGIQHFSDNRTFRVLRCLSAQFKSLSNKKKETVIKLRVLVRNFEIWE